MIDPKDEFTLKNPQASMLDDSDPIRNDDYTRRDHGGLISVHNGMDAILKNDKTFAATCG